MVEFELGREALVHASGVNVSTSGLLCKTDSYVEPDTEVSLVVTIPLASGSHTLSCEGVVVRSDKGKGRHLTAIHFTSLADKDVGALSELFESLPV
jgi:PilZ domain